MVPYDKIRLDRLDWSVGLELAIQNSILFSPFSYTNKLVPQYFELERIRKIPYGFRILGNRYTS